MMDRRSFFKLSGGLTLASTFLSKIARPQNLTPSSQIQSGASTFASVHVEQNIISIKTRTLTASIEKGFLTSLKGNISGEEFIKNVNVNKSPALQLLYGSDELVNIDEAKFGSITVNQISPLKAEIIFHSWDGDGVVTVSADPETGDLLIEPSAYSSRPGVRACRWNVSGINPELHLVAPFFQGIRLKLDDPLISNSRWPWPMFWEAGLAILQSSEGGFWIHTQDNHYRYKALQIGSASEPFSIGMDSEAYGPIDDNKSAGGLCWRINVFQGDWQVPALQYRDWLWNAYQLDKQENNRHPWIHDVKFAVSWCPGDVKILDTLGKRLSPQKVLLHFPEWRTDSYDENYPSYVASENGKKFIVKAQEMGFRIMPHFNSVDMDPSNPAYAYLRDFQYRSIDKKQLQGWSWYDGRVLGVPESNASLVKNRDKKVMVKIHPGLAMWRSILGQNILQAVEALKLETVFIDVTLVSQNLHNCFVDGTTPSEGMKLLIEHVRQLGAGLVVGGEGLNEITMQGLSFAQAHLFKSWQTSIAGLERARGCDLNKVLFGKLCRTIGYSGLSGKDADEEMRMQVHLDHGAIPTVTIDSAAEIEKPNAAVKRMLDFAAD
jgi:hypothetical protein